MEPDSAYQEAELRIAPQMEALPKPECAPTRPAEQLLAEIRSQNQKIRKLIEMIRQETDRQAAVEEAPCSGPAVKPFRPRCRSGNRRTL